MNKVDAFSRCKLIIISTLAVLLMGSCNTRNNKTALVINSECRPLIDGVEDECWENLIAHPIDGSLVGNINWEGPEDLSASFKVMRHEDDLYFLVKVLDDIDGKIEYSTLTQYYENDNIEFFFTTGKKLNEESLTATDSIFCFNYNLPADIVLKVVNVPSGKGEIEYVRRDIEGGYILEILFENELKAYDLTRKRIPFNIEVTDNDNESLEEGFIKGRESGVSWGANSARNSWRETLNYGDLIID